MEGLGISLNVVHKVILRKALEKVRFKFIKLRENKTRLSGARGGLIGLLSSPASR